MNKLDPKRSLCYTCKHGLCHSAEQAAQIGHNQEGEEEVGFGGEETFEEIPSFLEGRVVLSFCFWHPAGFVMNQATSLTAGIILECSKYEGLSST